MPCVARDENWNRIGTDLNFDIGTTYINSNNKGILMTYTYANKTIISVKNGGPHSNHHHDSHRTLMTERLRKPGKLPVTLAKLTRR